MNIISQYQNYYNYKRQLPTKPAFQGKSRELEAAVDGILGKTSISKSEESLLVEKLRGAIKNILSPKRYIGEGTHNAVYKITSKYAARVPVKSNIKEDSIPDEVILGQNLYQKMRNYFGEFVVKIGDVQILRNIGRHVPAGVPEHLAQIYSQAKIKKYYLETYLPQFARVSQYNYNELANNLAELNSMKFGARLYGVFDSLNPNNIVKCRNQLFLVDEIYTLCDKPYSNTTAKLLEVFVNRATKDIDAPDAGNKIKLVRRIFKKTVIAGSQARLIHADSKEDYKNWEKALQKCKINMPAHKILSDIERIEYQEPDNKKLMQKINRYINKIYSENPTNI